MPYPANIINVLIACPSDVTDEKTAIRKIIDDWNAVLGPDTKLIALPMNWETHVAPQLGGHPQTIINKELVEKCDILVAIFRARIGTPTNEAEGGTVEEIQKHSKAKKPAMVYFSMGQANLAEIDTTQLDAVRKFKEKLGEHGLLCEYKTLQDFCDKFKNHLTATILREYGDLRVAALPSAAAPNPLADLEGSMPDVLEDLRGVLREHPNLRDILWIRTKGIGYNWPGPHVTFSEDVDPGICEKLNVIANHGLLTKRDPNDDFAFKMTEEFVRLLRKSVPAKPTLSDDAKQLLTAASTDKMGRINVLKTLSSRVVHVGNQRFGDAKSAADFARWTQAVKDLEGAGFIEPQNADGLHALTHEGYQTAELLKRVIAKRTSIQGIWEEVPPCATIDIVESNDLWTASGKWQKAGFGRVEWEIRDGTIGEDGHIEGTETHTRSPEGWSDQRLVAKVSHGGQEISGTRTNAGGKREAFVWRKQ